jgi:type II secretory pathway pseudopilin PulG
MSHHKKGLTWLEFLFALALILILAGLATPLVFRASKGGARTEALNNAKAIAGGLVTFKSDRGSYPSAYTRNQLEEQGHKNLPPGNSANAYFAQLIVTEIIDSETYFYASSSGSLKGDDLIDTPEKILARGENGFAYLMTENEEALSDVSAVTPLVLAPVHEIKGIPTFDPIPFEGDGYFVYGAVDGSGKQGEISPTGQAMSKGRTDLLESGTPNSLFGKELPVIKYPLGLKPTPKPLPLPNWRHVAILLLLLTLLWRLFAASKPKPTKTQPEQNSAEAS